MSPNLKKEDPRITRTRNLILDAFKHLLKTKGFEALTVQDLTKKALINRATFYAHFPDKYALLDHTVNMLFRTEIEKRTLDGCRYSSENLKVLIRVVVEFQLQTNKEWAYRSQQFESLMESSIKKQIYGLLTHWLGQANTKLSTELPTTVAASAIYGLAKYYSHAKQRPTLEKFVDEAFPLVAVNFEQVA